MKKTYLLSAMIVLSAIVSLNAMEASRPAVWKKLDKAVEIAEDHGDWSGVFNILTKHGKTGDLVNEYISPDGDLLLMVALNDHDVKAAEILLRLYNANPNALNTAEGNPFLQEARLWKEKDRGNQRMVNLLKRNGATDGFKK